MPTQQSESILKLMDALKKAKAAFDPILKNAFNPHFKSKYADLSGVLGATEPHLTANGIQVLQSPASAVKDGILFAGVITTLFHESGEFFSHELLLPFSAADPQKAAGAITYARRYSRLAILDLAAEDDDANAASGKEDKSDKPQNTPKKATGAARTNAKQPGEPSSTPQNSTTKSEAPASPSESTGFIPEKELKAYYDRAKKINVRLPEVTGLQIKKHFLKSTGNTDLKFLSATQWETVLSILEALLNTDQIKKAIDIITAETETK